MFGRIYHVGLTVSDLERSIAFYRDVLGLEFQRRVIRTATASCLFEIMRETIIKV